MNSFSIDRFAKVVKRNIISNFRSLRSRLIVLCLVFAGFTVLQFMDNIISMTEPEPYRYYSVCSFMSFMFYALLFLGATQVCMNEMTKTSMASYMIVPASKTEKFLASIAYQLIVSVVMPFIAIFVADLAQLILVPGHKLLVCVESFGQIFSFFNNSASILSWHSYAWLSLYASIAGIMLIYSVCLFCGVFFRKRQPLWALAILFGVPTLLSTIFSIFIVGLYTSGTDIPEFFAEISIDGNMVFFLFSTLWLAISLLLLWLSHRIYCRIQLISNRFFNW